MPSTPSRRARGLLPAVLVTLIALLGAACAGGPPEPAVTADTSPEAQAAIAEGTLVWYAAHPPEKIDRTVKAFEAKYPGLTVQTVRIPGSQLGARYTAEAESGTFADVVSTSESEFYAAAAKRGWLANLGDVVGGNGFPEDHLRNDGTAAVWYSGPQVVVYNTDRVPADQVPRTWNDLLDPRFTGEIVYADPRSVSAYLDLANLWYTDLGPGFLSGLRGQNMRLVDSSLPGLQALAAGEAKIMLPTLPANVDPLIAQGAPLKYLTLSPDKGIETLFAVSAKAPHPKAAALFAKFLTSEEGQRATLDQTEVSPRGVTSATLPSGYQTPDIPAARQRATEIYGLLGVQ